MNAAVIVDVAAMLALRADAPGRSRGWPTAEHVRDAHDALLKLIGHWKWDLADDVPPISHSRNGSLQDEGHQLSIQHPSPLTKDGVCDRAQIVIEILATELLTRVYTVLLFAQGAPARDSRIKTLVNDLSTSMRDLGHRARRQFILLHPDYSWSLKLYRLQKRLDRWSDILLAPTLMQSRLDRFWMDRANADDWSHHPWQQMADRDAAALLLRSAIQSAMPVESPIPADRIRPIQQLLSSMLLLIPDEEFTSEGLLMTRAQRRAGHVVADHRLSRYGRDWGC